jgi:hypothetical protein
MNEYAKIEKIACKYEGFAKCRVNFCNECTYSNGTSCNATPFDGYRLKENFFNQILVQTELKTLFAKQNKRLIKIGEFLL